MKKTPVVVASHFHWDRAWYQPFQSLRSRLVLVVDELLEILKTSDYKVFHFDGQTVVLEDYLAIRPQKREEIARHVRSGRLRIGPWYVLADEFLAGGESLVRNLLMGHRTAEPFGPVLKVGYTPDSFGHVSQMPQILNGFGIDSFIYFRGLPREVARMGHVCRWKGPDGRSRVYACWLPRCYGQAPLTELREDGRRIPIPWPDIRERLADDLAALEKTKHCGVLLLCNGNDHAHGEPGLGEVIRKANRDLPGYRLEHAGYDRYVAQVARRAGRLGSYAGEMRSGEVVGLLAGTQSSRMYLKQANADCISLLTRLGEPMAVLADLAGLPYPQQELEHAWKKLLKNHPHDDICGCSVDGTHRDMDTRFRNCQELTQQIMQRSLYTLSHVAKLPSGGVSRAIAGTGGAGGVGGMGGKYRFRYIFDLPDERPRNVVLNASGKPQPTIPHAVRDQIEVDWDARTGTFRKRTKWRQELEWMAEMPAFGYEQFAAAIGRAPKTALRAAGATVENELLRVRMRRDGSVAIFDKKSGLATEGNFFEDNEDQGDGYDYSRLPASPRTVTFRSARGRLTSTAAGGVEAAVTCEMTVKVPASLTSDRKARSPRLAPLKIRTTAFLRPGERMVRFHTEVMNTARDHRFRVLFQSGVKKADFVDAETPFDVRRRAVDLPPAEELARHAQKETPTKFQNDFVSVSDGRRGLTVVNRGLPEYEPRRGKAGVDLLVTLFRCFGALARTDHFERGGAAGPELPTPDAQCLGLQAVDYAVVLHKGDWERAETWQDAHAFNTPAGLMMTLTEHPSGRLPASGSLFSVDNPAAVVSAVKAAENGRGFVIRLWNIGTRPISPTLSTLFTVRSAAVTNMLEEPTKKLSHGPHKVKLPRMRPKEILTIRLAAAPLAPKLRLEKILWPTGVTSSYIY